LCAFRVYCLSGRRTLIESVPRHGTFAQVGLGYEQGRSVFECGQWSSVGCVKRTTTHSRWCVSRTLRLVIPYTQIGKLIGPEGTNHSLPADVHVVGSRTVRYLTSASAPPARSEGTSNRNRSIHNRHFPHDFGLASLGDGTPIHEWFSNLSLNRISDGLDFLGRK
jgi:hypothetical protein